MQGDLPHTLYIRPKDRKGKKGDGKKPFRFNPNDPAFNKQLEANRLAEERRAAKKGRVLHNLDELIKK